MYSVAHVKRSPPPRCNEDEDKKETEGEGEGEGETRLIKRRPPPSANGPTAQELHAGNCCANTTTFILQPLGKRIYYSNGEYCAFLFLRSIHPQPSCEPPPPPITLFVWAVLDGEHAENLDFCPAYALPTSSTRIVIGSWLLISFTLLSVARRTAEFRSRAWKNYRNGCWWLFVRI